MVDVDEKKNRKFLHDEYPDIFETMFEDKFSCLPFPLNHFENVNTYANYEIYVGTEVVNSMAFICLCRKRSSKKVIQYFVSTPYYVSFAEFGLNDVGGRFVFWGQRRLSMVAFATDFTNLRKEFHAEINNPDGFADLTKFGNVLFINDVED